jgi:F0F1-type ATP synthase assembly protein I
MIKFLHLLCMLSFVGGFLLSCFPWRGARFTYRQLQWETGGLIVFLLLSVFLGVILVHQKGYFFTTPWIQAALIFSFIVLGLILAIFYVRRKDFSMFIGSRGQAAGRSERERSTPPPTPRGLSAGSSKPRVHDTVRLWILRLLVFIILIAIAHDAVTKTTGLL